MMLTVRSSEILEAAIRDFIETGVPVSSERLYKRHRFSVKPATIRNELFTLEEGDFLYQPHTSGGRVPTDKGYAFLVDRILAQWMDASFREWERGFEAIEREFLRGEFKRFVEEFSDYLNLFGVGAVADESGVKEVWKKGLPGLIQELDLEGGEEVVPIMEDVESLDERIEHLLRLLRGAEPRVFIGKSPITKSEKLSVVAQEYENGGMRVVLVAIGPKRMDYEHVLKVFKRLDTGGSTAKRG